MQKTEFSISLPILSSIAVFLPASAFIFCLFWSVIVDFDKATYTHCELPEFAPSISAMIGGFTPQKQVNKVSPHVV